MSSNPGADEPALRDLPASIAAGLEIVAARALDDPDDARDAVQETLARAVEAVRLGRVPPEVPLGAFVHGIARHVIADVIRRRVRERGRASVTDPPAGEPTPLDRLVSAEEMEAVRRALARIPRADRELLHRCFVDGERVADIAARLSEPAERLRQRKSRALKRLRAALDAQPRRHVSPRPSTEPT